MARYYFDLREGAELFPDEDGVELPTLRAAEMEAARALGAMTQELDPTAEDRDIAIEVRNDDGPLFQVALVFAVRRPKH
ncbi:hypothetical protein JQ617_10340 [Bradyrhizobium sp. KB893862 SZCCT0404]|uniref:DUF6894 family protein n=1 Tax=Bradyrhizobium sp. KB893862 SZCCT0404 TaxID=2807672 RepID=UPI001BABC2E2|nr:hypothetical protein [Bradyrhizobium sp. KB893862 SZCCT0404]MBR1174351.1 hypothetical protein [Bradyrhizobium sp. KB893862 SZCCT0404]